MGATLGFGGRPEEWWVSNSVEPELDVNWVCVSLGLQWEDVSSLLQFNAVLVVDCCSQIGNKKLALWAGLSLNGRGGGDCCPQS